MMMTWVLLAGLMAASAGKKSDEPVTCQAVYVGPSTYCSWDGTYAATGTGPNQKRAARAATERLLESIEAQARARVLQTEGTLAAARAAPELESCPDAAADQMRLSCFPDTALLESVTCYAEFDDRACWRPQMISVTDTGWKAMESAREQICEKLEERMRSANLSDAEQQAC
ncbi:MAG: hypothetical protein AAFV53_11700, partial [Myxococcota bacterium]